MKEIYLWGFNGFTLTNLWLNIGKHVEMHWKIQKEIVHKKKEERKIFNNTRSIWYMYNSYTSYVAVS